MKDGGWHIILLGFGLALLAAGLLVYLFHPAIVAAVQEPPTASPVTIQAPTNTTAIRLSIVIPAYDEAERLPTMLHEAYRYISSKESDIPATAVEWILVNDGSRDATEQAYQQFCQTLLGTWKLISFERNCGKGAAVQAGMLAASGEYILMVDADGATEFSHVRYLLEEHADIVFGSRTKSTERSFVRGILQSIFHLCVIVFVGTSDIQDTQCGFKLFRLTTAIHIFQHLHLRRWAFDTEILYLAVALGYTVREVPVEWHEVEGSKLNTSVWNLAMVSIGMLRDMVCVRLCYTLRLWKIRRKVD